MPIPRKNPRTVISEEQKKLTEDIPAQISVQPGSQGASSGDDRNNTKDQSSGSNNDTNSTNDTKPQNIQGVNNTDSINNTKDQSFESNNDINSTNDTNIQSTQSASDTNDTSNTKDQNDDTTPTIKLASPQASKRKKPHAQSAIEISSTTFKKLQNTQSDKDTMSIKSQNTISTKDTDTRSTEDREREVYYLTPSQVDKLDDLRIAYRKVTGRRLSKQDFMRHIVDSLDLNMLV